MTADAGFPEVALWAAEVAALDAVLAALAEDDWRIVTQFKDWRVREHIGHLCDSDRLASAAVLDPDDFRVRKREIQRAVLSKPQAATGEGVLTGWRGGIAELGAAFETLSPTDRRPWFGPDMSARAFVSARLMETWAHGQTVHDALGLERAPTDRVRPICELGWRTRGWSFSVRGLEVPTTPVFLALTAPSGAEWRWGDPEAADRIEGPAGDFALTVCQCRNIADTALRTEGEAAKAWMAIAQCFAGAAATPPPPGFRRVQRGIAA